MVMVNPCNIYGFLCWAVKWRKVVTGECLLLKALECMSSETKLCFVMNGLGKTIILTGKSCEISHDFSLLPHRLSIGDGPLDQSISIN